MPKLLTIIMAFSMSLLAVPAHASAPAGEPAVDVTSYALYLPEHAMRERGPSVEDLVEYLKMVEAAVNANLMREDDRASKSVSLVVGLKPGGKSRLWIVAADAATVSRLEGLLASPVESVPVPPVLGYNAFAINVDLWGGDGWKGAGPLPLPDAWVAVMAEGGILPDLPLSALIKD